MELTSEEGRVLGCLVEKQLTTPQLYPLTESALIAACNQSTNRNPVVVYDVSTVRITARGLREKGLLRMVHRTGERSDKHQHLLDLGLHPHALADTLIEDVIHVVQRHKSRVRPHTLAATVDWRTGGDVYHSPAATGAAPREIVGEVRARVPVGAAAAR